ncbi:MAG: hypothetical protein KAS32_08575 [Candidatus Peribacteraceae bacterium]|nr:hypothetical protein [Candidatus Peribacteraceae bacterium]
MEPNQYTLEELAEHFIGEDKLCSSCKVFGFCMLKKKEELGHLYPFSHDYCIDEALRWLAKHDEQIRTHLENQNYRVCEED